MKQGTHLHLIGIEGIGMSALARVLVAEGHKVSGCDLRPAENARALAAIGVDVFPEHDPNHLQGVDQLVVSNAVPETHPEVQTARERGIPVQKRIELLAEILARARSIGVTGTHGKSTTTAMLGQIFLAAGLDPTVLVGAKVPDFGSNARIGQGRYRIAEIDESDRLFPEARVDVAVLTNLEDDHIGDTRPSYHPSEAALRQAIRRWLERAGKVVYNADWPHLSPLLPDTERIGFGRQRGELRAQALRLEATGSTFSLVYDGRVLGEIHLHLPGAHNVENALAAAAAALSEGVEFEAIQAGLRAFKGIGRRFERVGQVGPVPIYDDYAHHPTEVAATLRTAKQTGRRVRAVFQPHRYRRTAQMWRRFAEALAIADEVVVLEIYAAGEAPIPDVSGEKIAQALKALGVTASYLGWDEALDHLRQSLEDRDLILTIGAGDVWRLARQLVQAGEAVWR